MEPDTSSVASLDLGRLIRIAHTVRSAMDAVGPEQAATSGGAMPDAYVRLRPEVVDAIPAAMRDEFERICPQRGWGIGVGTGGSQRSPMHVASAYHEARAGLAGIAGWLEGYIAGEQAQQQIAANAAAYAAAKVESERHAPGQYL